MVVGGGGRAEAKILPAGEKQQEGARDRERERTGGKRWQQKERERENQRERKEAEEPDRSFAAR